MDFNAYKDGGNKLYARLAAVVASRMKESTSNAGIRVLAIQERAKVVGSLERKLEKNAIAENADLAPLVKDLAGVRLVLYTIGDVALVQQKRLIFDGFKVDWGRSRLNYPGANVAEPESHFIGDNYAISLLEDDPAIAADPELKGLMCELQVQTALNHVWSETAHDTIYKRPETHGIGGEELAQLEGRMKHIARERLMPAEHEIRKVQNDFARLSRGLQLQNADALNSAITAGTNDERVQMLQEFRETVVPLLDQPADHYPRIRELLVRIASAAKATPVIHHDNEYGQYDGRNADAVLDEALKILEIMWHADVEGTFDTVVEIFLGATTSKEEERLKKVVGALSKQRLAVWRRYGPAVQAALMAHVSALSQTTRDAIRPLLLTLYENVLSSELTGTQSTSDTVTLQTGTVRPIDSLVNARKSALADLQRLYLEEPEAERRLEIAKVMESATRLPTRVAHGDDVLAMTLSDGAAILEFFASNAADKSLYERQSIERFALHLHRNATSIAGNERFSESARDAATKVASAALKARDKLGEDLEFVRWKTLVGFSSVAASDWEDSRVDYDRSRADRTARVGEFVDSISAATAPEWLAIAKTSAATPLRDGMDFEFLFLFLVRLGEKKPDIAATWLDEIRSPPLERVGSKLLVGLEKANPELVREYVETSAEQGRNLPQAALFLDEATSVDGGLVEKLIEVALRQEDASACTMLFDLIMRKADRLGVELAKSLAYRLFAYLSRIGDTTWTSAAQAFWNKSKIGEASTEAELAAVVSAITKMPRITYAEEVLLASIARRFPKLVVTCFEERLRRQRDLDDFSEDFEPFPFEFQLLHKAMAGNEELLVSRAYEWGKDQLDLAEFREARFIARIFPEIDSSTFEALSKFAELGEPKKIEFVLLVARLHDGDLALYPLYRQILGFEATDERLTGMVADAINATGMLNGEYGPADAERIRIERLTGWLADPSDKVRAFAAAQIRSHELRLAVEVRNAEADIAARRLEYGESPVIAQRALTTNE